MGATRARDPAAAARDTVRSGSGFVELRDGRWMDRVAVLEGAVLRHRVTRYERRVSALRMDPDLSVLSSSLRGGALACIQGHTSMSLDWVRDRRLSAAGPSPERFLSVPYALGRSLRPGRMLALIVRGDTFRVELDPPTPTRFSGASQTLEAVAAGLLSAPARGGPGAPVEIENLMFEALASSPDLLRDSTEPIGDMLRTCDLRTHWDLVGSPLTEWDDHHHRTAVSDMVRDERWRHEWWSDEREPQAHVVTGWYDIGLSED
jgi:hypothetical protein